jgi:hypothetical protein
MDFKSLLTKIGELQQVQEAKEETSTGVKHKGKYGTEYQGDADDEDTDGDKKKAKKAVAPAEKRGRGRPKKGADSSTGKLATYSGAKDLQDYIVGNKPSKAVDKLPKKKHTLKDWVEQIEGKYIVEAGLAVQPMPTTPQQKQQQQMASKPAFMIKDPANPTASAITTSDPAVVNAAKNGTLTMQKPGTTPTTPGAQPAQGAGSQVAPVHEEEDDNFIKGAIKNPGAFTKKATAHGMTPAQFRAKVLAHKENYSAKTEKQAQLAKTLSKLSHGKVKEADIPPNDSLASPLSMEESKMSMKKVNGKSVPAFAADGKGKNDLTNKKVKEAVDAVSNTDKSKLPSMAHIKKMCKDGKTVAEICKMHPNCNQPELKKMIADCKKKMIKEGMDQRLQSARMEGNAHGLKGHSHCGRNYDDLEEARCYHEGYKAGLDECYGQMPIQGYVGVAEAQIPTMYSKEVPLGMEHLASYKCPHCGIANKVRDWAANDNECPTCLEPLPHGLNQMGLKSRGVAEGSEQQLSVQQLAAISDEALDKAYGYGRSSPGNTFGWQANLKSASYAKQMIDKGITDIEQISDAIHKGWNVTAQAFVKNPDQFDDTAKLQAAGTLEGKLQQRAQLMKQNYAQLPDKEKEKDRVVARALLQALKGQQGVSEGKDEGFEKHKASEWLRDPRLEAQVSNLQVGGIELNIKQKGITGKSGPMGNPKDMYTTATNPMYFTEFLNYLIKNARDPIVTGGVQQNGAMEESFLGFGMPKFRVVQPYINSMSPDHENRGRLEIDGNDRAGEKVMAKLQKINPKLAAQGWHRGASGGMDGGRVYYGIDFPTVELAQQAAQALGAPGKEVEEGNAFTAALARTPHGGQFSVGGKRFKDRTRYDAPVDEMQSMAFEGWNNQLDKLLTEGDVNEGMSVSISKGQQGAPDSVSVTANDADADALLNLVKHAGLGLCGNEGGQGAYGAPTDGADSQAHGDIAVVNDHDGMMSLMKKLSGVEDGSSEGSDDYADEEGHDEEQEEPGHEHEEEVCGDCGEAECACDDTEEVDETQTDAQLEYQMAEDTEEDAGVASAGAQQAGEDAALASAAGEADAADEEEPEEVEESYANGADDTFEADIDFMTKVISGGLNKQKSTGQSTIPVVSSQTSRLGNPMQESTNLLHDWKKLSGIR